ncbi:MAG: amidohydrolase family protein [Actinomycetota bacterium]|nr:amidohydrolase family protein [Actinomycetota bacterium]
MNSLSSVATEQTVIDNATVLVGRELEPRRVAVAIEDELIAAVGRDAGARRLAPRVDAAGLLLMPGFIDAHVHIGLALPSDVLRHGVTTVRDLAWPPETIFELSRTSQDRSFDGPEILAAGPMLTVQNGYPTRAVWAPARTGRAVASPDDAETAVAETADAGARAIKFALNPEVGPVLDLRTLERIVGAAHERGLKTTGHVAGLEELDKALDAGADELAHMLMSAQTIPAETIDRMVGARMAVVPTLSIRRGRDLDIAKDNLRRFRAAGGTVVYGTDLGNEGPAPGIDRTEIAAMADAGFSARDVIASATVVASEWLGLQDRGAIETGLLADLCAVPEEALEDPALLADVRMVWRRGRRIV